MNVPQMHIIVISRQYALIPSVHMPVHAFLVLAMAHFANATLGFLELERLVQVCNEIKLT